jgi:hypothetical protein
MSTVIFFARHFPMNPARRDAIPEIMLTFFSVSVSFPVFG